MKPLTFPFAASGKSRWSIGKMLGFSFGSILFILAVLSLTSLNGISELLSTSEELVEANQDDLRIARLEADHLKWAQELSYLFTDASVDEVLVETDPSQCHMGQWLASDERKHLEENYPQVAEIIEDIVPWHEQLHQSAKDIDSVYLEGNSQRLGDLIDLKLRVLDVSAFVDQQFRVARGGESVLAPDDSLWTQVDQRIESLTTISDKGAAHSVKAIENYLTEWKTAVESVLSELKGGRLELADKTFGGPYSEYSKKLHKTLRDEIDWEAKGMEASRNAARIYSSISIPALEELKALIGKLRSEISRHSVTDETLLAEASSQRTFIVIFVLIGAVLSVVTATLVIFKAKGLVVRSSRSIAEASQAVTSAALQVQKGSESVAESSSEQASTLEETAAVMEEISSQTANNREKTELTGKFTADTISAIETTNKSLSELTSKISDLFKSSKRIQNVVQTIDEIAFQTNLLALNASVEAARAGEAGAGFAVVAEEVRALAMRAAASAKETGQMIDDSVVRISESNECVQVCTKNFDQVLNTSTEVQTLVDEVVISTDEQSQGINQINHSLMLMDKTVQANASGAEESASASIEMTRLSAQLEDQIKELQRFAGILDTPKVEGTQSKAPENNVVPTTQRISVPRRDVSEIAAHFS